MTFSDFIIWYLFLGGVGGGTYLAWFVLKLCRKAMEPEDVRAFDAATPCCHVASLLFLGAGVLCLLADLGNVRNAFLLFLRPTNSALSVGSFALAILLVLLAVLVATYAESTRSLRLSRVPLAVGEAAAALAALVTVVYTGVLLASMPSVPLWQSWLLPVLFALSACSTGIAVVVLIGAYQFMGSPRRIGSLTVLSNRDALLIALELLVLLVMGFMFGRNPVPVLGTSLAMLATGKLAWAFWGGCVGLGLVLPLALECVLAVRRPKSAAIYAIIACCVLVGGFFLRYCVVKAGLHLALFIFA